MEQHHQPGAAELCRDVAAHQVRSRRGLAMMNLCCVTLALAAGTMLLMPRRQPPIPEDVPLKEAA
ncbi:hypothetical protein [Streptomyces resistomycificus]|uniref:hypothetical protein n=1 Tax=Streptomyces resistomycificus TaxID=67356 RepID=UPI0009987407|nr:hypothetical protein [Streptomyces resistomycificus]